MGTDTRVFLVTSVLDFKARVDPLLAYIIAYMAAEPITHSPFQAVVGLEPVHIMCGWSTP